MPWLTRLLFLLLAGVAMAGVIGSAACTRRGKSTMLPPTASPLTTIDVNPATGSDTSGNGTPTKPYKTLTKAVSVASKSTTPLTISLAPGTYNAANGEIFPIVIPTGMSVAGTGYGSGPFKNQGSFLDGAGEDLNYEKLAGIPSTKRAYATLEVSNAVASGVALSGLYVGSSRLAVPGGATYAAFDALGAAGASHVTFGAGTRLTHAGVSGVLVAGGGLSCTACTILGSDYALVARTLPSGSSSGATSPSVILSGQPSQSTVGGAIGIGTDGSATIVASYQTFQSKRYAYRDDVAPLASPLPIGTVDFGHGSQSAGGNIFIGARTIVSEISVTVAGAVVSAFGNTWNPLTQGTNAQGQYVRPRTFRPGDLGKNVTIARGALGAEVQVGPIPPTPQPSPTPSGVTPTPSPT